MATFTIKIKNTYDACGNMTSDRNKDQYRGMPVGHEKDGKIIISSARDIGNWAAGYVAGVNGVSWGIARVAFDTYEMFSNKRLGIEELSTVNAEFLGWQEGIRLWNKLLPDIPVPIDW